MSNARIFTSQFFHLFFFFILFISVSLCQNCGNLGSCSECSSQPACGWCESSQNCLEGDLNGPSEGTCSNWLFSSCREYEKDCSGIDSCMDCTNLPQCGFCATFSLCMEGDIFGPRFLLNCSSSSDWFFQSCPDMQCEEFEGCHQCQERDDCNWCSSSQSCIQEGESCSLMSETCPPLIDTPYTMTMDESRLFITLQFEVDTDRGGSPPPPNCNVYFINAEKLGSNSACNWHDFRTLVIRLGNNPTIRFGQVLTLKPNAIRTRFFHDPIQGTAQLTPPSSPLTAEIRGPVVVHFADIEAENVFYHGHDSFGSGPVPFSFDWSIEGGGGAIALNFPLDPEEPVAGCCSVPYLISQLELSGDTTVSLTLRITNFLQEQSTTSLSIEIVTSGQVPLVTLYPPLAPDPQRGIFFYASVTPSTTVSTDVRVNYVDDSCQSVSPQTQASDLYLPPGYTNDCDPRIVVQVSTTDVQSIFDEELIFVPEDNPIYSFINGGTHRFASPFGEPLHLPANESYGSNDPSFSWTCTQLAFLVNASDTRCFTLDGEVVRPAGNAYTFNPVDFQEGVYRFEVTASAPNRGSTTYFTDITVAREPHTLYNRDTFIRIDPTRLVPPLNLVDPTIAHQLKAERRTSEDAIYTWKISGETKTSDASGCLTIQRGELIQSQRTTFDVQLEQSTRDNRMVGRSILRLSVTPRPIKGSIETPESGGSVTIPPYQPTQIFFRNFITAYPRLLYSVSVPLDEEDDCIDFTSPRLFLYPPSPTPLFEIVLPPSDDFLHLCAHVSDALGRTYQERVLLASDTEDDDPAAFETVAGVLNSTGDYRNLVNLVTLMVYREQKNSDFLPFLQTIPHNGRLEMIEWKAQIFLKAPDVLFPQDLAQEFFTHMSSLFAALEEVVSDSHSLNLLTNALGTLLAHIGDSIPPQQVNEVIDEIKNLAFKLYEQDLCGTTRTSGIRFGDTESGILVQLVPTTPGEQIVINLSQQDPTFPDILIPGIATADEEDPALFLFTTNSTLFGQTERNRLAPTTAIVELVSLETKETIEISSLSQNIEITFVLQEEVENPSCEFFNQTTNDWSSQGCEARKDGLRITCACNHLTIFTINEETIIIPPTIAPGTPTLEPSPIPDFEGDDDDAFFWAILVILAVLCLCLLLCFIIALLVYFKMKKKRDKRGQEDYPHRDRRSSSHRGTTVSNGSPRGGATDVVVISGQNQRETQETDNSSDFSRVLPTSPSDSEQGGTSPSGAGPMETDSVYSSSVMRQLNSSEDSPVESSSVQYSIVSSSVPGSSLTPSSDYDIEDYYTQSSSSRFSEEYYTGSHTPSSERYYEDGQYSSYTGSVSHSDSPSFSGWSESRTSESYSSDIRGPPPAQLSTSHKNSDLVSRSHATSSATGSSGKKNPFKPDYRESLVSEGTNKRKRFSAPTLEESASDSTRPSGGGSYSDTTSSSYRSPEGSFTDTTTRDSGSITSISTSSYSSEVSPQRGGTPPSTDDGVRYSTMLSQGLKEGETKRDRHNDRISIMGPSSPIGTTSQIPEDTSSLLDSSNALPTTSSSTPKVKITPPNPPVPGGRTASGSSKTSSSSPRVVVPPTSGGGERKISSSSSFSSSMGSGYEEGSSFTSSGSGSGSDEYASGSDEYTSGSDQYTSESSDKYTTESSKELEASEPSWESIGSGTEESPSFQETDSEFSNSFLESSDGSEAFSSEYDIGSTTYTSKSTGTGDT